jgi:hypothetical protein
MIRGGLLDVTVVHDWVSTLPEGTDPRVGQRIPDWLRAQGRQRSQFGS